MAHKTGHADKDAFEYEESTHFGRSSDERSSLRVIVFSFMPNIYGERHHIKQRIIENRHKRWCFFQSVTSKESLKHYLSTMTCKIIGAMIIFWGYDKRILEKILYCNVFNNIIILKVISGIILI